MTRGVTAHASVKKGIQRKNVPLLPYNLTTSQKTGDVNLFRRGSEYHHKNGITTYRTVFLSGKSLASTDSELVTCDSVVLVAGLRDCLLNLWKKLYLYLNYDSGRNYGEKGDNENLKRATVNHEERTKKGTWLSMQIVKY